MVIDPVYSQDNDATNEAKEAHRNMGLFGTPQATGFIEEYDFTVENAYFAPDATYNEDQLLLQWHGPTDISVEDAGEGWNPRRIIFSLGKGWATDDGGKSVYNTKWASKTYKDGDKFFQESSYMGKLIDRCIKDFGIQELLDSLGDPFTASTWVGFKFHMTRQKVLEARADFEPKAREWPQKFLGVDEDLRTKVLGGSSASAASKSTSSGASAAVAAAQARAKAKSTNGNGNGNGLRDQVVEAIKASSSFEEAQEKAFSIDGVTDDGDLVNTLLDPSGLYAEVKG